MFGFLKKKSVVVQNKPPVTTLEAQLSALERLGFRLGDGITVADLLLSFPRENYEKKPFDLILFMLGAEVEQAPWGRRVCPLVWNFDAECIYEAGAYVVIVEHLCRIAQKPHRLTEVADHVDLEGGKAWLQYVVDGKPRHFELKVQGDWVDELAINYVMQDIECDDHRYWFKDNGQAMVLYYVNDVTAGELNRLSNGALRPVLPV